MVDINYTVFIQIVNFVALIFIYTFFMDRIDRKYDVHEN